MKNLFKNLTLAFLSLVLTTAIAQDQERDYEHYDSENNRNYNHGSKNRKSSNMFTKRDFGLVLAINSFDKTVDMPELNAWQSRYVALQWRRNHRLISGRQVDIALGTGLEVGWNNFMMHNDEQYFESGGLTDFEMLDSPIRKSKLVVNSLNLPVMLQFGFKESNFRLGIGAYAGIRINSYQKFQETNDAKFREKGDYNLRKFNYGLVAELGRGDVRLFARYDGLPMFNDNNPINANVFSLGLRL
jgi:hypothetical protein